MSKSRDIADSAATINYIDGLTSDAQAQIDTATSGIATNTSDIATKAPLSNPTFTGTVTATSFSGDGSALTGVDSLPSQTGNAGKFLTTNGTASTWDAVDVSSEITGTLPVANGGTGTTATTFVNLATNVTGTLPVAKGGTGATSLTANYVLLGNGTSAPQAVAPSTSGNVLTSNGSTWQSTAPAGGGAWTYITSVTASGATTIDLTGMDNTYDQYVILARNFNSSVGSNNLRGYMYVNGTLDTTGPYTYQIGEITTAYSNLTASTGASSFSVGTQAIFTSGSGRLSFQLNFFAARSSTEMANWYGNGVASSVGTPSHVINSCTHEVASALITGIQLYCTAGTMDGELILYGIKTS